MKVYITRDIPEAAYKLLSKKGYDLVIHKKDSPVSKGTLLKNITDADAVLSLLTDVFDKNVIDSMKNCKVIANYAVGYNNIDVEYAKSKGIVVTNTPDVLTDSTAEIAMSLALCCARRIIEAESFTRSKKFKGWKPKLLLGIELKDKIFGIAGAGRIGSAVAARAKAFGMKIIYYSNNKNHDLELQTGAQKVSLNTLLKKSDFISLHLPLTPKTRNILNKDNLPLLKPTAILINTARGEIIDEAVLIEMLKDKKIFGAGFDVYTNEPDINPAFYELDNVVLLPHIGSATIEARNQMAVVAAKNIISVLSGRKPLTPV